MAPMAPNGYYEPADEAHVVVTPLFTPEQTARLRVIDGVTTALSRVRPPDGEGFHAQDVIDLADYVLGTTQEGSNA
ncbi:MAG TPA: hypothetical protein VK735_40000 [Pseudonocardia sp.]|uniref:hypothetical protein n=1 Tax=Pseudonocardia sp. TaxID=60912 RepID=UPI002C6B9DFD|nr:hypothetical protein [Pseudonocardia sp.]HTF53668.1 hypothetical protein [Pseudonocardia sp.]